MQIDTAICRNKKGPRLNDDWFGIYSDAECKLIQQYVELFPSIKRKGRFIRYLNMNNNGVMVGTQRPVGKNPMAEYRQRISVFLRLDNCDSYTSHLTKRTAGTLIANAGGTTLQLQRAGNWRSPRVAEGNYVRSDWITRI